VNEDRQVARVLQIHTRYRQAGGEDQVVVAEKRLLEEAGVDVGQVIFDNADLRESESLASDVRLAAAAIWSRSAEQRVREAILSHRPQVIHVHNTFSAASPSVYHAATALQVPVVQTLHNYRPVCPSATAFRDGHPCTDCVGRRIQWPGVLHACVRGSRAQSFVAAATIAFHRSRGTYARGIAEYIALTDFQRNLMIEGGLPAARIRVIPNHLEPDPGFRSEPRAGVLFVGRLTIEKGVAVLLRASSAAPGLVSIAGNGPLERPVQQAVAAGHVTYRGLLGHSTLVETVRHAIALVVPSIWFEGFPLVVLEAFAAGTPVIASRIGSLQEVVRDGETGLLVEPGNPDELAERIRWASDHAEEMRQMGLRARERYERLYRGATHAAALLDCYARVIESSQVGS
jgi:glycosyltransferase involved in cell wall biosynthesis